MEAQASLNNNQEAQESKGVHETMTWINQFIDLSEHPVHNIDDHLQALKEFPCRKGMVMFTDKELANELRSRGYCVTALRTIEL